MTDDRWVGTFLEYIDTEFILTNLKFSWVPAVDGGFYVIVYAILIDTKTSTYRPCKQICQNKNRKSRVCSIHPNLGQDWATTQYDHVQFRDIHIGQRQKTSNYIAYYVD